jgi:hypothetical protein
MIHHLSIAARDPRRVASVLAEIMGGRALPFPPTPGSFFALQLDENDRVSKCIRLEPSFSRAATTAGRL